MVDDPVNTQLLFQQFNSHMNVKVPQIQFIVRVPDFPVMQQRRVFTVQTVKFRVPLVQFVLLVDVAVFMQRHVGALVLRAVEVPQTQFIGQTGGHVLRLYLQRRCAGGVMAAMAASGVVVGALHTCP